MRQFVLTRNRSLIMWNVIFSQWTKTAILDVYLFTNQIIVAIAGLTEAFWLFITTVLLGLLQITPWHHFKNVNRDK